MGQELIGYVQTFDKGKWEVIPLKTKKSYMDEYEFTDIWCCGNEPYDTFKQYGTYIDEDEEKEIEAQILNDPEERSDYDSDCASDYRQWYKIGFGGLKYLALGLEVEDDERYQVKRIINEIVQQIDSMLRLANLDYKSFEDVRLVFYLSY